MLHEVDPNAWCVADTTLGNFGVELDIWFAHPEPRGDAGEVRTKFAHFAGLTAALIVPYEIITPPIPIDRLHEIDSLVDSLRSAGASGTEVNVLYAFGLHFNPEVPDFDPGTLVSILKSYALLSPWLWHEINPDMTRRLLGFAQPFEDEYVRKIVASAYWPELSVLIDDYLDANPTRHRDLDALPLFSYLDEQRVRDRLPREKIHPRPTFHYRLPDSRISEAGWSLAPDWNRWVAVERLAADRERLNDLGELYLRRGGDREQWAGVVIDLVSQ